MCDIKNCKSEESHVIWALESFRGRPVCEKHWNKHCDEKDKFTLHDKSVWRKQNEN